MEIQALYHLPNRAMHDLRLQSTAGGSWFVSYSSLTVSGATDTLSSPFGEASVGLLDRFLEVHGAEASVRAALLEEVVHKLCTERDLVSSELQPRPPLSSPVPSAGVSPSDRLVVPGERRPPEEPLLHPRTPS